MNKTVIKLVLVTVSIIGLLLGYRLLDINNPSGNTFDKCVTIKTTINNDLSSNEYCTNSEFLGELVDEYSDDFLPVFTGGKSNPFGRLLVELKGYNLEGNEFFFIYIDNVYGSYGIDQQPLEDGVTYELRLGTY